MPSILIVNRYFCPDYSASSQLATDLAFDLAQRGLQVRVVTSRQRYDNASASLPSNESIQSVEIRRVWTTRFGRAALSGRALDYLTFYLSASWHILKMADRTTTVIAMTDPPLIAVPALLIARLRGARLVNWLHDVFPEVAERLGALKAPVLVRPLRWLRNLSLRRAYANVVIGDHMAEIVRNESGIAPHVIPNWALEEVGERCGLGDSRALRELWSLGVSFVVGYSGNMGRAHRLDVLIEAAELLRDQSGIVFLLIGDGAQRAALEARARELGLQNVIFKPYQPRERLRETLSLPDAHVVSLDQRLEGLIVPSKFVGVIALGRPVLYLGEEGGEIGQLVAGSGCGVVIGPDDPQALAAAVGRLAGDTSAVLEMQSAALDLWARKFRRRDALNAWHDLLTRAT